MGMLLSLLLVSVSPGMSPVEVVDAFFDAVQTRDGEAAVDCLSEHMFDSFSMVLAMVRSDPSIDAEEEISNALGVEFAEGELDTISARGFGVRLLTSDAVYGAATTTTATCGGSWVSGDSAFVEMNYTGAESGRDTLLLVRESDGWKLQMGMM
jgi:hypothetical protein